MVCLYLRSLSYFRFRFQFGCDFGYYSLDFWFYVLAWELCAFCRMDFFFFCDPFGTISWEVNGSIIWRKIRNIRISCNWIVNSKLFTTEGCVYDSNILRCCFTVIFNTYSKNSVSSWAIKRGWRFNQSSDGFEIEQERFRR